MFFQKGSRLFFMTTAYFTFVDTRPLFSFLCVGIFGIYKILYEVCDKTCSVYLLVMKDGLVTGEFDAPADHKPSQVDVVSLMM